MAMLVADTSFGDIVYQFGVCSSGSINGVLAGSHYNGAWAVHSGTNYLFKAFEPLYLTSIH